MLVPPPPVPRDLLPPLLACLPTSFISPKPPPSLLPLLSPILRQRLSYNFTASGKEGWLSLLSWDQQRAAKLPGVVERMDLEPHPVSGELELEEVRPARYRRLDEETLQACLEVEQFDLLPIYVWCESDEHGQQPAGWKLTELRALEDLEDIAQWSSSPAEATAAATRRTSTNATPAQRNASIAQSEDDSYWAAYDNQATETPAQGPSPAPPTQQRTTTSTTHDPESDYYSRYANEVQPAMDGHDPDEVLPDIGHSTLDGTTILSPNPTLPETLPPRFESPLIPSYARNAHLNTTVNHTNGHAHHEALSMPRPISPATSNSSVDKLEERAEAMAGEDRAQHAIKMHISTDVKSLYRLAKSAGMERGEFERVVRRELEVLSLLDSEE